MEFVIIYLMILGGLMWLTGVMAQKRNRNVAGWVLSVLVLGILSPILLAALGKWNPANEVE